MSYVMSQGLRIHYQVVGDGPALMLHHGTMGSGDSWRLDGYVAALEASYRLILVDARGHGGSDKPHDRALYTGSHFAGDVFAVLDDLGLETTLFWGYSLGARIGFEAANIAPERFSAFILGGSSPYAAVRPYDNAPSPDQATARRTVLARFGTTAEAIPEPYRTHMLANDFLAIEATRNDRPDISGVLDRMTMPCLLYAGGADDTLGRTKRAATRLRRGEFVELPGLGHFEALVSINTVLPSASAFLSRVIQ